MNTRAGEVKPGVLCAAEVELGWRSPMGRSRLLRMLRDVGFEMGRRLYVSPAELDDWTTEFREPFVAFIALDGRPRTAEALSDLARFLLDAGCIYSVTWGPQANRMDMYMDLVTIDKEEAAGLEVGGLDVMTVTSTVIPGGGPPVRRLQHARSVHRNHGSRRSSG